MLTKQNIIGVKFEQKLLVNKVFANTLRAKPIKFELSILNCFCYDLKTILCLNDH
jgi:hypothetical protein